MKTHTLILKCAIALVGCLLVSALRGQTVNLLGLSEVRENGTYTYYARGNSYATNNANYTVITPFTYAFYPGPPHFNGGGTTTNNTNARETGGLTDSAKLASAGTGTASSISIGSGKLTDAPGGTGTTDFGSYVANWVGVTQTTGTAASNTGTFDILFDLGSAYSISSIEVVYYDGPSLRITTAIGAQQVYTATTLADPTQPAESDFSLFGSNTDTLGGGVSTGANFALSITGTAIEAQYVDLRLAMHVSNPASSTDASQGAFIREVRIYGTAIPEPSTYALMAGAGALLFCGMIRYRRR